eukprot:UN08053
MASSGNHKIEQIRLFQILYLYWQKRETIENLLFCNPTEQAMKQNLHILSKFLLWVVLKIKMLVSDFLFCFVS